MHRHDAVIIQRVQLGAQQVTFEAQGSYSALLLLAAAAVCQHQRQAVFAVARRKFAVLACAKRAWDWLILLSLELLDGIANKLSGTTARPPRQKAPTPAVPSSS